MKEPGRSRNFKDLLCRCEWPFFLAFDLLAVDDEDIRCLLLRVRKLALKWIMQAESRSFAFSITPRAGEWICSGRRVSGTSSAGRIGQAS